MKRHRLTCGIKPKYSAPPLPNFPSTGKPPNRFKIKESELAKERKVKKLVKDIRVDINDLLTTTGVLVIVGDIELNALKTLIKCVKKVFVDVDTCAHFLDHEG